MFADLVPGTGGVSLSVGLSTALDAATILKALDRYPFGCSEQITSRAMPLLYVNELARGAHLAHRHRDRSAHQGCDRAAAGAAGLERSFGLWSAGGDDAWLDAYVTDFLTRAREKGFAVPDVRSSGRSTACATRSSTPNEPEKDGGRDLAYASTCWPATAPRRSAICVISPTPSSNNLATPIAKAQMAAALALVGDRARAERVYAAALDSLAPQPVLEFGRVDYGSALRDAAALVTLASEGDAPRATMTQAVQRVEAARGLDALHLDAGECLAGARRARAGQGRTHDARRRRRRRSRRRSIAATADEMRASRSRSPTPARRRCRRWSRCQRRAGHAGARGLERLQDRAQLLHARRRAGRPTKAKQNDRFAVVLKITEAKPEFGRVMVADYLPAGLRDRQSASGLVRRHRHAGLDRGRRGAGEHRVPRRPFHAPRSIAPAATRRCSRWPMWCARCRPANTCCRRPMSRTCTIPRAIGRTGTGTIEVRRRNERRRRP